MINMESRKTNKEIVDTIVHSITEKSKSIHEIASDTDINWESVKNYLEILKGIGFVKETSIGNKRVFSINETIREHDPETLFGIPINENDENTINYLFMKIRNVWNKKTGKPPGKTQVQKALVEIDKLCKLDLPIAWYRFGKMCLKTYDPNEEYEFVDIKDQECDLKINEVIEKVKHYTVRQLKLVQYLGEKNELYIKKEELLAMLLYHEFKKTDITKISEILFNIIHNLPKGDDKLIEKIVTLTTEYTSMVIQVLNSNDEKDFVDIKRYIISTFEGLWELIASYCFYTSLRENPKYDNDGIYEFLKFHFSNKLFFVKEEISSLSDFIVLQEDDNKDYKALKELQQSVVKTTEKISKEERKKMIKEIDEEKESDELFRKAGLNNS